MWIQISPWSPLRWLTELSHVWRDTRLIVLTAQIAAIYAAILIPFKVGIPLIPGFAELRPANAIPLVTSLLFGPAAAWGAGLGNLIGDCFGTLGPASVFGFAGNMLFGYIPYLLWGNMGPLSSRCEPGCTSWRQAVEFVVVCLLASWACAATIAWGVEVLGLLPFAVLAPAIFFNNVIMGLLLGPPLLYFLYPRVKRWGLLYRDLRPVPPQLEGVKNRGGDPVGDPERDSPMAPGATLLSQQTSQPGSRSSALLSVRNLTFHYAGSSRPALSHVSLDLFPGEWVVVMGRSGSGKSTLCYALNGLVPHFWPGEVSGSVQVKGVDTVHCPVWKLAETVGVVFQDFDTQLISTNVEAELRVPLESGHARQEEIHALKDRIHRTLEVIGLSGLERRDPGSLSGGQRQRLVVGSVLVREPAVVVMDQPMTDLDPVGRRQLLELLHQLRQRGVTIVLTEHDPEVVLWADRVCLLDQGMLVWEGRPDAFLRQPHIALQFGVRPTPFAQCFEHLKLPELPITLEEAMDAARRHSLTLCVPSMIREAPASRRFLAGAVSSTPALELDRVSYWYESANRPALKHVSVTIRAGEFVGIVGRNGSGKSTLAQLLNGLLMPREGSVRVFGHDTRTIEMRRMVTLVGYVFQNPDQQIFAETVWEEVAFGVKNVGCPPEECRHRVREALEAVGLEGTEQRDPFSLTKGERQRVAVASVLAARPKILIFDEPNTGLDARETDCMLEVMVRLQQQGHTVVMITHTVELVARYASRCLVMQDGTLMMDGPPRQVFANADFVAAASLELPAVTRFAQHWGVTLLTVEEVQASLKIV
ncbi:MAG: ATP-binding cassette domain-containing protein [Nitrospirae bacterium]|nr:MAG: ATP-binding cassette domain-containing protein [Nitrospirota bacterium]